LLEIMNQTVRRPSELVKVLGAAPFGTVSYLPGPPPPRRMTLNRVGVILLVLINIPILLAIIHLYVAPLSTLLGLEPPAAEVPATAAKE
jgi:hypothetical protein